MRYDAVNKILTLDFFLVHSYSSEKRYNVQHLRLTQYVTLKLMFYTVNTLRHYRTRGHDVIN